MALVYFIQCKFSKTVNKRYAYFYVLTLTLFLISMYSGKANSEYIAEIKIKQGTAVNSVYVKLLENDAPLTVQNFRNYIADGDYSNSFIHRSEPGSIIQGGGFTFDPTLNGGAFTYDAAAVGTAQYPGGLQPVPVDNPVDNEFGNSNLRGTLAMAKEALQPDSARSQWFVNLADNSHLDSDNGGYTVFAKVLGNGMNIVDGVADPGIIYDRNDIHPLFDDIPLLNFILDPVIEDNLVRINSITEVLSISSDISFGTVTPGSDLQSEIVMLNTGIDPVLIGNIVIQNSLLSPFSLDSDLCSNRVLSPGKRCSVIALFSPSSPGPIDDDLVDIEFPALDINYLIKLSGTGGSDAVEEADIRSRLSSMDYDVRDVRYGQNELPHLKTTTVLNLGGAQLDFVSIALSQDSDAEFSLSESAFSNNNNCLAIDSLAPDGACKIEVAYLPLMGGNHKAKLIIVSNDPDESPFEIPIFAVALSENDGVDTEVEDSAPNLGDGNNDDILDSRQSHIVSLPDLNGNYITYVSEPYHRFSDVRIIRQDANDENPDNLVFDSGVHEFTLNNVASDAVVDVGLLLPAGVEASDYYIYGPTSDNTTPHWYRFNIEGETGTSFVGVAQFTSPSGNKVDNNVIFLRVKNGGRGDSSSTQDNVIVVKSALKYSNKDSSSGFLSILFIPFILSILLCFRTNAMFRRLVNKMII